MDYELGGRGKRLEIPPSSPVGYVSDYEEHRERRKICGCGVWTLLVALIACTAGFFVMMTTNWFILFVHKNLTLRNNSLRFETWRQPPVHAVLRVYLFNYTNIEQYESGVDKKIKVEEVGPYTYIETLERVNVTYGTFGTLTYRDKKTYVFAPELSAGTENDLIIAPNIPYFVRALQKLFKMTISQVSVAAASIAKVQNFMTRLAINGILKTVKSKPFIDLGVKEFLWGYNDGLSYLIGHYLSFTQGVTLSGFGLFQNKNATQEDAVTIFTGEEDVMDTGIISQYGERSSLDYWETEECNRIDGTDGTIYPPGTIKPNRTLYLYVKEMCRRVPMVYETNKIDQHGLNVLRYHVAKNIFESGKTNPENRCFCHHGKTDLECMPSGVFNVSPCAYGGPIMTSLPHFLYGDPLLFKDFEGLSPHPMLHESFVEIDPKLGIPMSGKSRFQLNVMLRKSVGLLDKPYRDKLILPVSWMDYGFDRLPDNLASMIYSLVLLIDLTEICLTLSFAAAAVLLSVLLVKKMMCKRRTGLFGRNLDVSTADVPLVICTQKS